MTDSASIEADLLALFNIYQDLRLVLHSTVPLCDCVVSSLLRSNIEKFGTLYEKQNSSVILKMHVLADHVVEFIQDHLSLGIFSEQGLESLQKTIASAKKIS